MPNQFSRPWTLKEIDFLKESIHKLTYKKMGVIINRSPSSIQSKIRYLPFKQKVKKYSLNFNFFKKWSSKMAYVLGFIAADGNICHSGRSHVLHVASDDEDIIKKIKIALSYQGPIHQKIRDNHKISYSLRICDKTIFQSLQKLNITERKSLTFSPPKIPKDLVRHFIRGYFDGDGSVSIRNPKYKNKLVVDIYTASPSMAQYLYKKLKKILEKFYSGKIRVSKTSQKTNYYAIRLAHKASMKLYTYMYKGTNFFMERKHRKFRETINYEN